MVESRDRPQESEAWGRNVRNGIRNIVGQFGRHRWRESLRTLGVKTPRTRTSDIRHPATKSRPMRHTCWSDRTTISFIWGDSSMNASRKQMKKSRVPSPSAAGTGLPARFGRSFGPVPNLIESGNDASRKTLVGDTPTTLWKNDFKINIG